MTDASIEQRLAEVLDLVPELGDGPREITELPGGLTNRNYRVTTSSASVVVRVSPTEADALSIDRDHEYRNSVAAAEAGVGAPVIAYLPEHAVMVVGYIDGVTFTEESFAAEGVLARVAESCRRLHAGRRFVNDFDMFAIQRRYLELVQDRGYRLPEGYLEFGGHVERIREAVAVLDEGTVPCNNDLLAGNFVDDGEQIWLIDYEYGGNNDACFELGNVWSENHLSVQQLEELVIAYYGRPRGEKVARCQLYGLMSKYGWTLWASIQDAISDVDFDFWTWGMDKYERAVAEFDGPEFTRLIHDAQQPDNYEGASSD